METKHRDQKLLRRAFQISEFGWSLVLWWIRYRSVRRDGVSALAHFLCANGPFRAAQVPGELATLGTAIQALCPKRALEIGTAHGGTLFFLCRLACPEATIISVDLPRGRLSGYGPVLRLLFEQFPTRAQRLFLLQGDSHSLDMRDQVKEVLAGQELDYLFIDADHTYEGVRSDFEMYNPLVRKGGLIAFHDIVEGPQESVGGVPLFWNEIKVGCRSIEIIEDHRQGWGGIGVLFRE